MDDTEPRPAAAQLVALQVDDWSDLLAVALPVVRDLPDRLLDARVKRVAALPPGRLVSGRSRRDLATVLAREEVWDLVADALPADAARPWAQVEFAAPDTVEPAGRGPTGADVARLEQQVDHLRGRERRLTGKVAELRDEVDRLRRERDGAVVRADSAAAAEEAARAELEAARSAAEDARETADAAEDRIARELARAERREHAEVAGLRDDLRAVRRARDGLRQERDRLRRELQVAREAAREVREASSAGAGASSAVDDSGGRRGRPSRLPDGLVPGTRRAAEWLVAGDRVLLVDGYNVTRTHRSDLPLVDQRRWLEEAVSALAQRRQVDARIVWDSARGRPTTRRGRGGITVRFTDEGVTADDELVLHVQLAVEPDRPVVAVTDDVELRTRLAQHGVDLLDSTSFTWLL